MVESAVQSHAEIVVGSAEKSKVRVLHVDDEPAFLSVTKQCLELDGMLQVDSVSSVEEALAKLQEEQYDAVVSDYQMPEKDGLAFLKELRTRDYSYPFILFTGKGREEVAIRALNLGAEAYVNKVGDPKTVYCELAHSIRSSVAKREAQKRLLYQVQLIQSVSDAIIASDASFFLTSWNQAAERMYGWKASEVIGRLDQDVLQSEFVGIDRAQAIQMLRESGAFRGELIQLHRNGHRKNVESNVRALRGESNQIIGYVSVNRDVSELRNAEEAAKESEEKWGSLAALVHDGIVTIDLKGVITSVNDAFLRLTGCTKKEIVGKHFGKLPTIRTRDIPKYLSLLGSAIRGKLPPPFEYSYVRKDGSVGWAEAHIRFLKRNGKMIGFQAFLRETTESHQQVEALRKSEEKYRTLIDNSLQGIVIIQGFRIVFANSSFAEISGYTIQELLSLPPERIKAMVHPEDQKFVWGRFFDRLAGKPVEPRYESRGIRKDGSVCWLEIFSSLIVHNGKPAIQVTMTDITERKKVEEVLRESEEKYRRQFEEGLDAIFLADAETGVLLDCNGAAAKLVGREKSELIGKHQSILHPPEKTKGGFSTTFKQHLKEKEGQILETHTVAKNGEIRDVAIKANLFELQGKKVLQGVFRDITEHKRAEKAIRESRQKFEGLFRHNPEAAVYLDPNFKIVDVNPRFCQLFGCSAEEVKGKKINDVVVPEGMREEAEGLDKDAKNGYASHYTVRKRKDGSLVHVSISAAPVTFENNLLGYVGIYKDITKLRDIEERLKETNKKLGTMNEKLHVVGGLTRHDVRNKLSTVTGNVYLLKRKLVGNPEALEQLAGMENAVRNAEVIFEFARTYEMLGVEELDYVDAKKAVDEAAGLFPDLKGASIVNDCGGLTLLTDSLLRQLFYNLIDNSLKYGEKLTRIRISYEKSEDRLKLIYEDDGIGIPHDARPKLFTEGFTTGKGSGYGLYLIGRMMDVYGWTIDETGVPGKGAQFTMSIPKAKPDGRQNYKLS